MGFMLASKRLAYVPASGGIMKNLLQMDFKASNNAENLSTDREGSKNV